MKRCLTTVAIVVAALLMTPSVYAKAKKKPAVAPKPPAVEESAEAPAEIPETIIHSLAAGDLNGALIIMRDEKPTPKLRQLMNDASRVATFEKREKLDRSESHKAYQNMAVSFHNLYLFLKRRGIDQKEYFDNARKYYSKARSSATVLHKSECDLLMAALLASAGEGKKAQKIFDKIDLAAMRGDFESVEYMAAYYAAAGQTEEALDSLNKAYRISPDRTLAWLAVGDDFAQIEQDPGYRGLVDSWNENKGERGEFKLSVPKGSKPRLEMASPAIQFAPQKMMKHASVKEASKVSSKRTSKKSTASSRKGSRSAAKSSSKKSPVSAKKSVASSGKAGASSRTTSVKSKSRK